MNEILSNIWKAIEPQLVSAIILIILAATGLVVAWLKAQTRKWETKQVKEAVAEVEESASGRRAMTNPEKRQAALNILKHSAPDIPEGKASKMIAKAVSGSHPPPPLPGAKK